MRQGRVRLRAYCRLHFGVARLANRTANSRTCPAPAGSRPAIRGRLAWQPRPPARVLSVCTPPAVIRARSSNQLGQRVIPTSVANRRRRARFAYGRVCRLRVRTLGPTDRRPRPAGARGVRRHRRSAARGASHRRRPAQRPRAPRVELPPPLDRERRELRRGSPKRSMREGGARSAKQ